MDRVGSRQIAGLLYLSRCVCLLPGFGVACVVFVYSPGLFVYSPVPCLFVLFVYSPGFCSFVCWLIYLLFICLFGMLICNISVRLVAYLLVVDLTVGQFV